MANHTEQIGVNHCGEIAEINDWMYRIQPVNDVGIDAHMEYVDNEGKPQLLGIQIKTGKSYFEEKNNGCVIFRKMDERQYKYWTMNTLPCIIVLYNSDDGTCIWQKLNKKTIERTEKGFLVRVPLNQVFLDDKSNGELLRYTNLPEHITNYNFLLSQKKFMQIIKDGGIVKLHSEEWVNKCSGKGKTELIVEDGNTIKTYPYPYWFPYTLYTDVFPRLFPWADFSVDEDYYEETDETLWRELNCHYDKEEDEWIEVGDSFEVFRESLEPMRYIDHAGEVAEYMLVLSLNELGESFLKIDTYVSQPRPYSSTRPNVEGDLR